MPWMRLKFPRRRRRNVESDLWRLGLDAREVMLARILLALGGRLSANEARRMVVEKQSAAWRAQLAYLKWLLEGEPAAASQAAFDIYHREVRSNRKRLGRRRWRLPMIRKGRLGARTSASPHRAWRALQKMLSGLASRNAG
jgi:hypothetical protein